MDRYDRLIRDVQQKTENESIRWEVVNAGLYKKILLNIDTVVRAFTAEYPVGNRKYTLLLTVGKKHILNEYLPSTDAYNPELFILDIDGQVVLSLYDGLVD